MFWYVSITSIHLVYDQNYYRDDLWFEVDLSCTAAKFFFSFSHSFCFNLDHFRAPVATTQLSSIESGKSLGQSRQAGPS